MSTGYWWSVWYYLSVPSPLTQIDDILEDRKKAKPKTAKHKERTDEELFGNTNDIFGDIPSAKPKATKKKKKKKAASAADGKGKEDVDGAATTGAAEKADESQGTPVHSLNTYI